MSVGHHNSAPTCTRRRYFEYVGCLERITLAGMPVSSPYTRFNMPPKINSFEAMSISCSLLIAMLTGL
jgi:hypothetical protein